MNAPVQPPAAAFDCRVTFAETLIELARADGRIVAVGRLGDARASLERGSGEKGGGAAVEIEAQPSERALRIADDGEILMRGPHVFLGYFKDEALTQKTGLKYYTAKPYVLVARTESKEKPVEISAPPPLPSKASRATPAPPPASRPR